MPVKELDEDSLLRGMREDPWQLDQYGDPIFLKELLCLLLAEGRWAEADALVAENDVPNKTAGTPGWHHILFARALDKAGRRNEALNHWTRFAVLYPNNAEARKALQQAAEPVRPVLTLPEDSAALLRAEYAQAKVIVEYGAGGSTVEAGSLAGTTVFSVESDPDWVSMMQRWFEREPPIGTVHFHSVDIGPTGPWGHPKDTKKWRNFVDYPLSVWDRPDFLHPDVVMIDGRFRVGCFIATLISIRQPTRVLFDDYGNRPHYHIVEEFSPRAYMVGRMAVFNMTPRTLGPTELRRCFHLMTDVR